MCQGWHAGHSAVTSQACSSSPTGSMVAPPIVGFMGLGNMGIGACRKHLCTCKPSTMPATMTHCHRCACRLSKQHTALPERARGPRRVLWQAARAQPYAGKSKAGAGPWRLPQSNRQRCAAAPALLPNKPSPQFLLFHTCCNCCWPSVRAPRRCTWRSAAWRLNDSLAWTILWLVTSSCVYTDLARSCNIVFAMLFDDAALEATFGEFLVTAQAGALLTSGLGICVRLCCQYWRDKRSRARFLSSERAVRLFAAFNWLYLHNTHADGHH